MIYIEKKDVPQVILNSFPEYSGNKFKLEVTNKIRLQGGYWQGGSKETYRAVNLDSGMVLDPGVEFGNPFTCPNQPKIEIPRRNVIVKHTYFCGSDMGLTIYANKEDMTPLLPNREELSFNEKVVLIAIRSNKNTYGGKTNLQFNAANRETGISESDYLEAKASLIQKGHLNKRGSITNSGRNAVGMVGLYELVKQCTQ